MRIRKKPKQTYVVYYDNRMAIVVDETRGKARIRVANMWNVDGSKLKIRLFSKSEIISMKKR